MAIPPSRYGTPVYPVAPAGQTGAASSTPSSPSPPAPQQPDTLTALTNDIRVWKAATVIMGAAVVYLAATAWWRGRAVSTALKQLEGAKSESAKRAAAIAAAKHALG